MSKFYRYYHDDQGKITGVVEFTDYGASSPELEGAYVDLPAYFSISKHKVVSGKLKKKPDSPVKPQRSWDQRRKANYGTMEAQFAMLYDDIKAGVFGDAAKQGSWFKHISAVKQRIPKQ